MSISKDRFKEILSEEVKNAISENQEVRDSIILESWYTDLLKAGAKAVGMALLQQMMTSKEGRNNLADILVAIPDFVKTYICDSGHIIREEFELEGNKSKTAARVLSLICRGFTNFSLGWLYMAAFILRKMSDKTAERILKEKGKSPAPAPENDTTQNDAPAEDGSPREPIVVDAEVVDTDDDLDLDDLPGFGRTNESKEVLRFLKIIRENDLVK
tara:strand:+ start:911 stop:1555 length:645 start_codon:yes stop_codon:yes gene_type:complete